MGQTLGICMRKNCFWVAENNSMFCRLHQPRIETKDDMVNHPPHYNQGKFEVIDIIEDNLKEGFEPYLVGNILKYVMRYKHKNGLQDLEKAKWYLEKLITSQKEKPAD